MLISRGSCPHRPAGHSCRVAGRVAGGRPDGPCVGHRPVRLVPRHPDPLLTSVGRRWRASPTTSSRARCSGRRTTGTWTGGSSRSCTWASTSSNVWRRGHGPRVWPARCAPRPSCTRRTRACWSTIRTETWSGCRAISPCTPRRPGSAARRAADHGRRVRLAAPHGAGPLVSRGRNLFTVGVVPLRASQGAGEQAYRVVRRAPGKPREVRARGAPSVNGFRPRDTSDRRVYGTGKVWTSSL